MCRLITDNDSTGEVPKNVAGLVSVKTAESEFAHLVRLPAPHVSAGEVLGDAICGRCAMFPLLVFLALPTTHPRHLSCCEGRGDPAVLWRIFRHLDSEMGLNEDIRISQILQGIYLR